MKFMRMSSGTTYGAQTQSVAIIKALYKLFLSGVGNNATYAADPVCGAFFTAAGINIEGYGADAPYPITDVDANTFIVTTPNYKVRCYIASGTKPQVWLVPYLNTPVFYNASNAKQITATPVPVQAINSLNYGSTTVANTIPIELSIFFGLNTVAYGETTAIGATKAALFKIEGSAFVVVYRQGAMSTASPNEGSWIGVYHLTENTTDLPVPISFGTNFGVVTTHLIGNVGPSGITLPKNTIPCYTLADTTLKPVMKMKIYHPDFETDLSEEGVFLHTLGLASEFAPTVVNLGTTYRQIGGAFLVAT